MAIIAFGLVIYVILLTASHEPNDESSKNLVFGSPEVTLRPVDDVNFFDITVRLEKFTPKDSIVAWSELRVNIKKSNGELVVRDVRADPDDPFNYYNGTNPAFSIEVWYIDSISRSDRMDPGDSIKVTGLTGEHEFGRIDILVAGEKSGSFVIPEFQV